VTGRVLACAQVAFTRSDKALSAAAAVGMSVSHLVAKTFDLGRIDRVDHLAVGAPGVQRTAMIEAMVEREAVPETFPPGFHAAAVRARSAVIVVPAAVRECVGVRAVRVRQPVRGAPYHDSADVAETATAWKHAARRCQRGAVSLYVVLITNVTSSPSSHEGRQTTPSHGRQPHATDASPGTGRNHLLGRARFNRIGDVMSVPSWRGAVCSLQVSMGPRHRRR
jgi:hypothetical protein